MQGFLPYSLLSDAVACAVARASMLAVMCMHPSFAQRCVMYVFGRRSLYISFVSEVVSQLLLIRGRVRGKRLPRTAIRWGCLPTTNKYVATPARNIRWAWHTYLTAIVTNCRKGCETQLKMAAVSSTFNVAWQKPSRLFSPASTPRSYTSLEVPLVGNEAGSPLVLEPQVGHKVCNKWVVVYCSPGEGLGRTLWII